jgi:hypothetical protein
LDEYRDQSKEKRQVEDRKTESVEAVTRYVDRISSQQVILSRRSAREEGKQCKKPAHTNTDIGEKKN